MSKTRARFTRAREAKHVCPICKGAGCWDCSRAAVEEQRIAELRSKQFTSSGLEIKTEPSGALKYDDKKPPFDLLPYKALSEVAKVLDFGRAKYAAHNWRKGMAWGRVAGAALRHIYRWLDGEDKDPETGLHPLAHACCEVLFGLEYALTSTGADDRWKKG